MRRTYSGVFQANALEDSRFLYGLPLEAFRVENAGCLFSRAAFVSAVSMPAMRMRMHAERMDAVKAAL